MNAPARTTGVPLARLGAAAFVLGLAQGLGGIVRDCALTCHVGYRFAPIAFLVVAALSLPAVALQLRGQRRFGHERWRVNSTLFVAATLLAFRLLLALLRPPDGHALGLASRATYLSFYVWVDVAFLVLGSQLFGLLDGDEQAADRGLAVFAGAIYAGGLLGGLGAASANGLLQGRLALPFDVARDHLMIAMGLVLVLLVPLARSAAAATGDAAAAPAIAAATDGARAQVLRILVGDPDGRAISLALLLTAAAGISLESLFFWILTEQSAGGGGFVRLLATLAVWVNGASFLLATVGTSRIIRRLGIAAVVLAVPACLLVGSGWLLLATAITVMLVLRVLKDTLAGGLYEPASERLLVRLQGEGYGLHRPLFDAAGRVGTGVGALLVLLLTLVIGAPMRALVAVVVALHLGWLLSLVPLLRRARVAPAKAERVAAQ